jgi:glycine/D-amino acid oxidase-like deaminating enzyme
VTAFIEEVRRRTSREPACSRSIGNARGGRARKRDPAFVTRIAIIGAGLLGASLADRLAGRGAEVTVVEGSRPGADTSGTSIAWVNAQAKAPAEYFARNVPGVAAHHELAHSLGGDWYHPGGDIAIGHGLAAANVREQIERHRALDCDVHELDRSAVAALEPDLDLCDDEAFAGAHFPAEARIDVPGLIGRLLRRARSSGARILCDVEVVDLETQNGRVVQIVTQSGDRLTADLFVLAAGPASERLAGLAGVSLPMAPTPGLLVGTVPVALSVAHVIHAEDVTLRPDGGDRLMVASRHVDATLDHAIREIAMDMEPCRDLLARARQLIPDLGDAGLEAARIGVRSVAVDGMPVAGFAPSMDNLYLLVSHRGATIAPVLGELVAGELLGERREELEPTDRTRFV